MPTALFDDVSEQYLELVREHLHRFRDALAVYFEVDEPDRALIEMPDGCVPFPRRRVTDLLEFAEVERCEVPDPEQLELRLPSPPPPPPSPVALPDPVLARASPSRRATEEPRPSLAQAPLLSIRGDELGGSLQEACELSGRDLA